MTPDQRPLVLAVSDAAVDLTDEVLLGRCARGDENALAELYDRHGRMAYALALRIVRDPDLAEDAVQEGFLAVWRTAGVFVPERAKPSTWILTLVHRRAVDLVRREERRRAETLADIVADRYNVTVASVAPADETAWLSEQRDVLRRALCLLSDDQREALELAYYGGFTQSELAERLGVPLGTIKSRTFAGLRRLRDLLAEPDSRPTPQPCS